MKVGVLALQGAFAAHLDAIAELGGAGVEVRRPADLADVDRLILPGGESTTMSMMLRRSGLLSPVADFVARGRPVFGTCAGAILLASEIVGGRDDQVCLGAVPVAASRNAFGTQRESFEADLEVSGVPGGTFRAVFIRAPRLAVPSGSRVPLEVLAEIEGSPALVRSGAAMCSTFHPELTGDTRIHRLFCEMEPVAQSASQDR